MAKSKAEILAELRTNVHTASVDYTNALEAKDMDALNGAEEALKEAENEYAAEKAIQMYDEFGAEENPMIAAVTKHDYPILGHKVLKEDGKVIGIEVIEDKERQVDLVKMCKYLKLPHNWQYKVEKFNQLLRLRAAQELKLPKADVDAISQSFYMNKLAREIDMGGTPTSNTQICKQLQEIVDDMIFVDNGKGKNTYKVNNHDVAYLLMCYTGKGKATLAVKTQRHNVMHRLIADIEHRVVTGKSYSLEYKVAKKNAEDTHVKAASEVKVSKIEPNAEETAVPKPEKADKAA